MSVDAWKTGFDTATVLLAFLVFVAGAGALITGRVIDRRKTQEIKQFDSDLTRAKSDLATQQKRAAEAEGKIADAEQHIAEANAKAAEASEAAERERLARTQLEGRFAWRRIEPKSQKAAIDLLKAYKGSTVTFQVGGLRDPELDGFVQQVYNIFDSSAWKVDYSRYGLSTDPILGCSCQVDARTPAGQALEKACSHFPGAKIQHTRMDGSVD